MTREDLKNYKYNQIWIKNQKEYIEGKMSLGVQF